MAKRMLGVVLMMVLGLSLTACSSAEITYVPDGGTYTAVTVEGLATTIEEPSFMGVSTENVAELRTQQLTALRAEEGSAAALADILTNQFPTEMASVPYYAEEAVVDGQETWVVLEVWGSADETLDKRRLWVLRRGSGEIVLSSVFN